MIRTLLDHHALICALSAQTATEGTSSERGESRFPSHRNASTCSLSGSALTYSSMQLAGRLLLLTRVLLELPAAKARETWSRGGALGTHGGSASPDPTTAQVRGGALVSPARSR